MSENRIQEIACQQVLVEDSSVFSIQWSVFPHKIAAGLTPDLLIHRYLDYIKTFTGTVIRPVTTASGIKFCLLNSQLSLINFLPPVVSDDLASRSGVLYVCGGILVQPHECDRGELRFKVEVLDAGIKVSLQLSDFCPLILGGPAPSITRRWLYRLTQAAIHRLVTIRFLELLYRSLGGSATKIRIVRASVREGMPV